MRVIDIGTNVARFRLFALQALLALASTGREQVVRDLPREQFFEGPALWRLVLVLAPIVQAATRIRLDLLRGVENGRFTRLWVMHHVVLDALRGLLGLHGRTSDVLRRNHGQSTAAGRTFIGAVAEL